MMVSEFASVASQPMPYIVGPPIRRPADFYGRFTPAVRFFEIIGGTQAQSISVRGLRRAGKTSFLHYVTHPQVMARYLPQPERYIIVYIDISACRTPADFYQRVQQQLQHRLFNDGTAHQPVAHRPAATVTLFDLEMLLRQFPQYRFVLLLDEFDHMHLEHFGQDFLVELRALTSMWEYDLACVTASYWDLYHLGGRLGLPPTSPFYNIFHPSPLFLPGLAAETAVSLIEQPAQRSNLTFTPEQVEQILQMAGTLPFFVQATAAKWYQLLRQDRLPAGAAIQQLLINEMRPYFHQWWRNFDQVEQEMLRLMAQQQARGGVANTAVLPNLLYTLHNFGLVVQERGRLFINGDLFAHWIETESLQYEDPQKAQPVTTYNPTNLRRVLVQYFDLEELRTLCFDLQVDFDLLSGSSKGEKTRELVLYWQKRGQLDRLVEAIRYERGAII